MTMAPRPLLISEKPWYWESRPPDRATRPLDTTRPSTLHQLVLMPWARAMLWLAPVAQYQGSATIDMGRGAIVIGLAAVIIGEVLLDKVFRNFALKLLSAVIGAIIYYVVITVVLRLGLESTDLKLLTALVVAVFLAVPYWKGRYFTKPVRKEGAPHA